MEGGEVKWRTTDERPILTVDQTRRTFRDIVLGLEYRSSILVSSRSYID
jgi:hypothetical protein